MSRNKPKFPGNLLVSSRNKILNNKGLQSVLFTAKIHPVVQKQIQCYFTLCLTQIRIRKRLEPCPLVFKDAYLVGVCFCNLQITVSTGHLHILQVQSLFGDLTFRTINLSHSKNNCFVSLGIFHFI